MSSSERYYRGVEEIKEVYTVEEANKLLKEGWELLRSTEKTVTVYILGMVGPVPSVRERPQKREEVIDPSVLENLPWSFYKGSNVAGWIFADPNSPKNKGHEALIQLLREEMDKRGGTVQIGKLIYSYSGPPEDPKMFISRRPA